jgi:hypothetical protein
MGRPFWNLVPVSHHFAVASLRENPEYSVLGRGLSRWNVPLPSRSLAL